MNFFFQLLFIDVCSDEVFENIYNDIKEREIKIPEEHPDEGVNGMLMRGREERRQRREVRIPYLFSL